MTDAEAALSRARRIDSACDQFESALKAGKSPNVDDLVALAPESDRDSLRVALVAIEQELQRRSAADTSVTRSSLASPAPANPDATALHRSDGAPLPTKIARFEILGVLGTGAFGRVFKAHDPELGRDVAIKMPLSTTMSSGEKERFLRESRAAAKINHPNVCQVFETGEYQGRPYIVMAIVPGQSLAEVLKQRKEPLPNKQIAQVARKIALALSAAHDRGIVHRDLKPANVMFDRERKDIVVMDFGLARGPRAGDARATHSGAIMGTPAYMSPEQARGDSKEVGPTGDIYSLGVILYELLTGTRPFVGTATEVIGQILHVEPEAPSKRRGDVDPALEAICLKAISKDPSQRYGSMKELAKALDAHARPTTAPVSPSTDTGRTSDTKDDAEKSSGDGPQLSDVFAVLSADRKAHQVAVEGAVKRWRTPPWVWLTIILTMLGGFIALGGIVFFSDRGGVRVTIELTDINLQDQTLRFLLDNKPTTAEALSKEIELSIGEHDLIVKRGDIIVKRMKLTVKGKKDRVIKVRDVTPPSEVEPVALDHRALAEWTLSIDGILRVAPPQSLPADINEYMGLPLLKKGATLPDGDFKIVGLEIHGAAANDDNLERFRGIDSLLYLQLQDAPMSVEGLRNFAACRNLEICQLTGGSQLNNDAAPVLAAFKKIAQLNIVDTRITDEGLESLAGLHRLEDLSIGPRVNGSGLASIRSNASLRALLIKGRELDDAGAQNLAHFPGLEQLALVDTDGVGDEALAVIGKLDQLTHLYLESRRFTNKGVAHLSTLKRLTELRLRSTAITDEGIQHLNGLWRLNFMNLTQCEISGSFLKELKQWAELKTLFLGKCPVTDEAIANATWPEKFWSLGLGSTQISDKAVEHLAAVKNLKDVNLSDTKVTNEGLLRLRKALPSCHIIPEPQDDRQAAKYAIALHGSIRVEGSSAWISKESQLPSGDVRLTGLNLDGKKNIRNHDLAMFQNCTALRDILLDRVGVTDEGLGYFRKNKQVTSVNIIDAKITNEGMSVFENWTELQHLWAMGVPINGGGVAHLKNCKKVQTLDLSFTQVGGPAMVHLRDCLELRALGLSGTRVDDAGLRNFDRCAKLQRVYLTNMSIGDFGVATFAGCNQMTTMNLSETKVTDEVFKTLRTFPNLKSVNLRKTKVSQTAIDSFKTEKPGCRVEK